MKFLLWQVFVLLLISSCHDDLEMSRKCEQCRAEGTLTAQAICFQAHCNDECKPAPGVADTSSNDVKAWRCGCLPAEKKP